MYWNKGLMSDVEFDVCHQEAMCDEDMPAVFQYFTKVSSLPSRLSSLLLDGVPGGDVFLFWHRRLCVRTSREAWTPRTPTGRGSRCRSSGTFSTRGTSSKPKSSCCRRSWPTTKGTQSSGRLQSSSSAVLDEGPSNTHLSFGADWQMEGSALCLLQ